MSIFKTSLLPTLFVIVTLFSFDASAVTQVTSAADKPAQSASLSMEALKVRYFDAAREGDSTMLQAFYNAGLDVNVADEKGYTALILAAYHGHTDTVNFLIEQAKVNPCQEDNRGNTALMGAIFKGHVSVAKQLVFTDCDIDEENAQGQTALMFASASVAHRRASMDTPSDTTSTSGCTTPPCTTRTMTAGVVERFARHSEANV